MAGSVNKVILVGNLGADPDIRAMQNGAKVANLSVATSESWKDKSSGERQERTQWHKVVVFNEGIIRLCESYLKKGSKVYLEGQIETRKWQNKEGVDQYTTEVVLRPYRGELTMLDSRGDSQSGGNYGGGNFNQSQQPQQAQATGTGGQANNPFGGGSQGAAPGGFDDLDDDIPF